MVADKNNIVYKIECSKCEAMDFRESKRYFKVQSDEHERCDKNCDCEKNEIEKHRKRRSTFAGIKRKLLIVKAE